jgi:hypothetical protein
MSSPIRRTARRLPGLRNLAAELDRLRSANADLAARLQIHEDEIEQVRREAAEALTAGSQDRELDYLFIVTYGRSGSTLLQGILNSIPGYLIRGENRAAVYHLYEFHRTCIREMERVRKPGEVLPPSDAYFGMDRYPEEVAVRRLRQVARDTLLRPDADTRVAGFKEIRWYQDDVADYVEFMRNLFPGARFILNTRNHDDVLQSRWWRRTPDAATTLSLMEERIMGLRPVLEDSCFHLHFDDYVDDPGALEGLFSWLGEDFDIEQVRRVMSVRHSF